VLGFDLRRVEVVVKENEIDGQQPVRVVVVIQANGRELVSRSVQSFGRAEPAMQSESTTAAVSDREVMIQACKRDDGTETA
jgi:hypothetical protein